MTHSPTIRRAAAGQDCTLQIAGVCNRDPSTTVACHLSTGGMAMKCSDLDVAFACSACHDALDRRVRSEEMEEHRHWYTRRAHVRTLDKLVAMGILTVKGMK